MIKIDTRTGSYMGRAESSDDVGFPRRRRWNLELIACSSEAGAAAAELAWVACVELAEGSGQHWSASQRASRKRRGAPTWSRPRRSPTGLRYHDGADSPGEVRSWRFLLLPFCAILQPDFQLTGSSHIARPSPPAALGRRANSGLFSLERGSMVDRVFRSAATAAGLRFRSRADMRFWVLLMGGCA